MHDPPTWYVWVVRLTIVIDHLTTSDGTGLGLTEGGVTPGSGTPGGNGFERDPMNAPTLAQARRITTQSSTRAQPRTASSSLSHRAGSAADRVYRPRPVISARSVSPKLMNDAQANGTHGRTGVSIPTARASPARATTCANTNRRSGR